jgi:transposase
VKRFQAYDPEQPYLLPPAPRDWLPEGHLAFFVHDIVEQLDLSAIYRDYGDGESGGRPPFEPLLMLRVWVYAYAVGIRSSRKVQRALVEDVAFRFLSGNQQPRYWALNQFRTRHQQALSDLFVQSVKLAAAAGLVKLGHVAIDGSKLKANASKSKAMSYARMQAEERRLREEIEAYLRSCDEVDAREDEEYGPDDDGMGPPAHLRRSEDRLAAIKRAKEQLEREAVERAERDQQARQAQAASEGRAFYPRSLPAETRPGSREQRNFTDPDSRMMRSGKEFVQAYNGQIAVDSEHQVIVAAQATNLSPDAPHLPALLGQAQANTGRDPDEVSGDAGYYSEENINAIAATGATAYLAPGRIKHNQWRAQQAPRGRIPKDLTRKERMSRLLATKKGKARYLLRQITAEPVFGQIKHTRGLRQVLHRGLEKVNHLWRFDCAIHNLLKIHRHARKDRAPAVA